MLAQMVNKVDNKISISIVNILSKNEIDFLLLRKKELEIRVVIF